VISENESLLLYRGFRAMDGNVAVALKVLVRSSQMSLQKRLCLTRRRAERARFDP